MRRIIVSIITVLALLATTTISFAEVDYSNMTSEELIKCITELEAENDELKTQVDELKSQVDKLKSQIDKLTATPKPTTAPTATPAPQYQTLEKGSKGEEVKKLQTRLKELNWLSGNADGDYGNMTATAISSFQQEVGLPVTGIADDETQISLYAKDAPKAKVYNQLDYKAVARDPDAYSGNLITFSGKVVQVMEEGNLVVFRIASKGSYDDVVYCIYYAPDNYSRILEDDRVTVYGTCTGIYTYTTIMGGSVTIPSCIIDRIELK